MKPINLIKVLEPYKSGWVALSDKNYKVIAHAKTFATIHKKVGKVRNILLVPASTNYSGFVTNA